jgi:hypothetical protein
MRDLIQLEAWVSDIVDRVKRGIAIEDDRIEFKRKWPDDPYKAARLIAGFANAARGGEVLLLVGIDPKEAPYFFNPGSIEPANWFPQVFGYFTDEHTPAHRMFQIAGTEGAPVAIAFDPAGAPFLVTNPKQGTEKGEVIQAEVPWREATRVRTAKRREILSMMYRHTLVPDVEIFDCEARVKAGARCHYEMSITVLIICRSPEPIVLRLNRVSWRVGLNQDSEGAPVDACLNYYDAATQALLDDPYLIVSLARALKVDLLPDVIPGIPADQLWVQAHFEFGAEPLEKNVLFVVPVLW